MSSPDQRPRRLHLRRPRRQLHRRPRLGRRRALGRPLAARLRGVNPELDYLNLAVDGATSAAVLEQVPAAIALEPDLLTVVCGANDVLLTSRPDIASYDGASRRSSTACATALPEAAILTATAPEGWHFMELRPRTKARLVRGARATSTRPPKRSPPRHGVPCLDVAGHPGLTDPRTSPPTGCTPRPRATDAATREIGLALRAHFGIQGEFGTTPKEAEAMSDTLSRDFDRLEAGDELPHPGPHDHRVRPGLLRRPDRRLPPAPHRRRVGGREPVRRPHRPRHAGALLLRRPGPARPRAGGRAARLRPGRLQAPGQDRRHDPRRGRAGVKKELDAASGLVVFAWRIVNQRGEARRAGQGPGRLAPRGRRQRPRPSSPASAARAGLSVILAGKRILVTGVVNRRSIAFAIAERAQDQGAEVLLTSFGRVRRMTERAATRLPDAARRARARRQQRRSTCAALREELDRRWGRVDGASTRSPSPRRRARRRLPGAPRAAPPPPSRPAPTRFKALAEALAPLMEEGGGSLVGLDFDATVAWPSYDWMGVAKAALESVSRYLARDLGPSGRPGQPGLRRPDPHRRRLRRPRLRRSRSAVARAGPLGWDADDPTPVADAALFLLSDLARGDHRRDPPRRRRRPRDRRPAAPSRIRSAGSSAPPSRPCR